MNRTLKFDHIKRMITLTSNNIKRLSLYHSLLITIAAKLDCFILNFRHYCVQWPTLGLRLLTDGHNSQHILIYFNEMRPKRGIVLVRSLTKV